MVRVHPGPSLDTAGSRRAEESTGAPGSIRAMPRLSTFYGIVIWMYHDEPHHRGRPHFHATYGGDEASIDIETLLCNGGRAPGSGDTTRR